MAKSLVLVIGAGASCEVGLPVGAGLKKEIVGALNIHYDHFGFRQTEGDDLIGHAFRIIANELPEPNTRHIGPLLQASKRIVAAMPQSPSIDNFIDSHRGDELIAQCGKLAIVRCILAAERRSRLFVDFGNIYNTIHFDKIEETWFSAFFQILVESCQKDKLAEQLSKIAIVCFNYDRCVEHYLHGSIRNYFGVAEDEATTIMSALEIYHPYGVVGTLPWQGHAGKGIRFGDTPTAEGLVDLAKGIRTFTQGVDPAISDIGKIRESIATARQLAFLGFAYHKLNLELLFSESKPSVYPRDRRVYGTALGISRPGIEHISEKLSLYSNISSEHIHLHELLSCAALFQEYRRSLGIG